MVLAIFRDMITKTIARTLMNAKRPTVPPLRVTLAKALARTQEHAPTANTTTKALARMQEHAPTPHIPIRLVRTNATAQTPFRSRLAVIVAARAAMTQLNVLVTAEPI